MNSEQLNKDHKRTKFLIYLFIFLIILFIYKTWPYKNEELLTEKVDSNETFISQVADKDSPINEADLEEEEGKYIEKDLRFTFRYPKDLTIQTCEQDSKCIYIPERSIRVEFLQSSYYNHSSLKDALLEIDLFCSYQTNFISTSCTNIKMEEYINSQEVLGYILYRTKYIRETNQEDGSLKNGTYYEKAYIFPIKDEIYGLAIISTDSPLRENQETLEEIIETFKLI